MLKPSLAERFQQERRKQFPTGRVMNALEIPLHAGEETVKSPVLIAISASIAAVVLCRPIAGTAHSQEAADVGSEGALGRVGRWRGPGFE